LISLVRPTELSSGTLALAEVLPLANALGVVMGFATKTNEKLMRRRLTARALKKTRFIDTITFLHGALVRSTTIFRITMFLMIHRHLLLL